MGIEYKKPYRIMQLKDHWIIYDSDKKDFIKDVNGFYLKYWGYSYAKHDVDKLLKQMK